MNIYAKDYHLVSDPEKVQTEIIQAAIDDCAKSGGGTVYFEPGIYRSGTIYLRSNTYLYLPPMCVIKGSDNFEDYNEPDAWPQNWAWEPEHASGKHLIVALEIDNAGIMGGGTIDGNGKYFGFREEPGFWRPSQMVYLCESTHIRLRNLELINSPYWTCYVHGCEDVMITGVHIKNNPEVQNGDGIDIDASSKVIVSDCLIDSEDDCITFRCNRDLIGYLKNPNKILEDVTVTNCQLHTSGCNAFRIGVGDGKIRNCNVSNIVIRESAKGICLEGRYTFNDDEKLGCQIENISFNNVYLECKCPLFLASQCDALTDKKTPLIRNIRLSNFTISAEHNIVVQANEGATLENISFSNIFMDMRGIPECVDKYGYGEWDYVTSPAAFYVANAQKVSLNNVQINVEEASSTVNTGVIVQNTHVAMNGVSAEKAGCEMPVLEERS